MTKENNSIYFWFKYILKILIIVPGLLGLILFPIICISYTFNLGIHIQQPTLLTYINISWMFISTYILYWLLIRKLIKLQKYKKDFGGKE